MRPDTLTCNSAAALLPVQYLVLPTDVHVGCSMGTLLLISWPPILDPFALCGEVRTALAGATFQHAPSKDGTWGLKAKLGKHTKLCTKTTAVPALQRTRMICACMN